MSSPVLGIDLGTTNSVVAVAERTGARMPKARVLIDADGNRLIPSVVSFHPQGDVLVGYAARERRLLDAKNTIYSIKRLIGRPFRSVEVQRAEERFPFELEEAPNKGVLVKARGERYTLPEISAFVLREVRRIAELSLGADVNRAVVTVPANFTELQRSATKAAGKIAGLDVLRILNEPTAAALAYGYGKGSRERIAVYDMGGGTFDVTILELSGDVFEVMATAGDTFLGGDDVDLMIAEKMADAFLAHHRFDPRQDSQAFERLRAAAEWSKCQLSEEDEIHLRVEELAYGEGGVSLDLTFGLSRLALEEMVGPLIARTFDVCEEAMKIAGIRPTQLDNVILVGGSTRIPLVRRMVGDYFGREPLWSIDPDLVVAQGAALQGWALRGASIEETAVRSPSAIGKLALKRVTQSDLKSAKRRAELDEEVTRQRPQGPAFAPKEPPAPPPSVAPPAPVAPPPVAPPPAAGQLDLESAEGWLGPRTGEDEETLIRKSPFDRASAIPSAPLGVPPPPPVAGAPPAAAAGAAGVVAARSVPIGETARGLPPLPPMPRAPTAPPAAPAAAPPAASPPARPPTNPATRPAAVARPATAPSPMDRAVTPVASPLAPPTIARPGAASDLRRDPIAPSPALPAAPASVPPRSAPRSSPPSDWSSAPASAPLLLDVTPHSLGVETVGGFCEQVIKRNAAIPVEQTKVFSTASDMQETVLVRVVQGESRRLEENQPLGEIRLDGLRQALRGQVKIGVTFLMDADGTLGVKARDLDTGREQTIRIQLLGAMSEEDIVRLTQRQQHMVGQ